MLWWPIRGSWAPRLLWFNLHQWWLFPVTFFLVTFSYLSCDFFFPFWKHQRGFRGHRGCDRMVVGFTTAYATSAYHHWFLRCITLCDKVCLAWDRSLAFSSSSGFLRHDITELLLKVALNTINQSIVNQRVFYKILYKPTNLCLVVLEVSLSSVTFNNK
jgi:hypothetical protein